MEAIVDDQGRRPRGRMVMSAGPGAAVMTNKSRNCPSPPRFQMPARKATMSPAAISKQGDIRVSVSCSPAPAEQTALQHIAIIGDQGLLPRDQQDQPAHDQRQDNGNQHADPTAAGRSHQPFAARRPAGRVVRFMSLVPRRSCGFRSGHQQSRPFSLHIRTVLHDAGEPALEHDADPIADLQQLVEVGGDDER